MGPLPTTEDFSLEPPDTHLDDADEKKRKRLSKSKQWKQWKEYALSRKELYRRQTPGGASYNHMTKEDAAFYGAVGNAVMEEIDNLINYQEGL